MIQKVAEVSDLSLATGWVLVERQTGRQTVIVPTVIVVASATNVDATRPVARALCEASCDAGRRTAHLDLGSPDYSPSAKSGAYEELSLPKAMSQRKALDAALPSWRFDYDVIIVEVSEFAKSAIGAHITQVADGVVVALFADRRVTTADRYLRALLKQLGISVIGVVRTTKRQTASEPKESRVASVRALFAPVRQK